MLSPRQIEILSMIASGFAKKEIAYHLHLSEHSVNKHVRRAFCKLGAHTAPHAVYNALTNGIVLIRYIRTVTRLDH